MPAGSASLKQGGLTAPHLLVADSDGHAPCSGILGRFTGARSCPRSTYPPPPPFTPPRGSGTVSRLPVWWSKTNGVLFCIEKPRTFVGNWRSFVNLFTQRPPVSLYQRLCTNRVVTEPPSLQEVRFFYPRSTYRAVLHSARSVSD